MSDEQKTDRVGLPYRWGRDWACPECSGLQVRSFLVAHGPDSGLQCPECGKAWSQLTVDRLEKPEPEPAPEKLTACGECIGYTREAGVTPTPYPIHWCDRVPRFDYVAGEQGFRRGACGDQNADGHCPHFEAKGKPAPEKQQKRPSCCTCGAPRMTCPLCGAYLDYDSGQCDVCGRWYELALRHLPYGKPDFKAKVKICSVCGNVMVAQWARDSASNAMELDGKIGCGHCGLEYGTHRPAAADVPARTRAAWAERLHRTTMSELAERLRCWIPVSEHLPEDNVTVIARRSDGTGDDVCNAQYRHGDGQWYRAHTDRPFPDGSELDAPTRQVTHWMPYPDFPTQ